jgi:tetratricopeptide (TPR) repeat protein
MNPIATVVVSVLLASAAATAVVLTLRPTETPHDAGAIGDLQRTVAELRTQNADLQQKLDVIAKAPSLATAAPGAVRSEAATVSAEQVAAAVEAYLGKRAAGGAGAVAATDGAAKPAFDMDTDFAQLIGHSYWENGAAWRKAFESGRMDEVIAKFEALAKASPKDVKTQMDLANAYLAYLQFDQTKWQLSMKADGVFDRVLDIDERHWEARFTKAMSYTFWPDFLGKKKDAIGHFETLVQQQEGMPPQPHEAQTYLYLGNLLETRDPAKAREIWAKGARRHPDNQELAKKARG